MTINDRRNKQKGQAVVEFALILPILLLLIIGAVDIATMIYSYHRMVAATREGIKLATESTLEDNVVIATARDRAELVLQGSGIPSASWPNVPTVTSGWQASGGSATDNYNSVYVRITYTPHLFLQNLINWFLPTFNPNLTVQWSAYRGSDKVNP